MGRVEPRLLPRTWPAPAASREVRLPRLGGPPPARERHTGSGLVPAPGALAGAGPVRCVALRRGVPGFLTGQGPQINSGTGDKEGERAQGQAVPGKSPGGAGKSACVVRPLRTRWQRQEGRGGVGPRRAGAGPRVRQPLSQGLLCGRGRGGAGPRRRQPVSGPPVWAGRGRGGRGRGRGAGSHSLGASCVGGAPAGRRAVPGVGSLLAPLRVISPGCGDAQGARPWASLKY